MAFPTGKSNGNINIIVFTTQGCGRWPILGAYYTGFEWCPIAWQEDGRVFENHPGQLDITNAIQKGLLKGQENKIQEEPLQVETGSELRSGNVQEEPKG